MCYVYQYTLSALSLPLQSLERDHLGKQREYPQKLPEIDWHRPSHSQSSVLSLAQHLLNRNPSVQFFLPQKLKAVLWNQTVQKLYSPRLWSRNNISSSTRWTQTTGTK
jgi:hypothetical protein